MQLKKTLNNIHHKWSCVRPYRKIFIYKKDEKTKKNTGWNGHGLNDVYVTEKNTKKKYKISYKLMIR